MLFDVKGVVHADKNNKRGVFGQLKAGTVLLPLQERGGGGC